MNIYEISQELQYFLSSLPDTGELSDEDLALYSELTEAKDNKIKSTAYAYHNLQAELDGITAQIKRLTDLKKSKEVNQNRIKRLIDFGMSLEKTEKLDLGDVKIFYTKSTGTVVSDESLVPDEYKKEKTVISIDLVEAKKAINAGIEVAGIHLEERKNLQIK